jgi:DNA-binding transcriptional LysR family regulator
MRYDLTTLEIFVAVAEEANLTRAASRVHLAVSAVSKRITELEELAGASLLERLPRGVALTPAGQSLLHYARQVLRLVDSMKSELSEYAGGVKGHVRIHASTSALTQFVPQELATFLNRYPMIRIEIEERVGAAIVRAVADGIADVGILGSHTPSQGLATIPYHHDQLVLVVPASHALARRKQVRFADALAYPFVAHHPSSSLNTLMTQAASEAGKPLQSRIQVSSFECMCRLVAADFGVALLPEGVLGGRKDELGIKVVQLKDAWAMRQLVLVVRDPDTLPFTTRTLIEHLRASAAAG